ncbi:hypothetical protein [Sphingobacterium prati]|nr:hypothetical protein [Sphingobacterium prati]
MQIPLDFNEVEDFYNYLKADPSKDYTYFDAWAFLKVLQQNSNKRAQIWG